MNNKPQEDESESNPFLVMANSKKTPGSPLLNNLNNNRNHDIYSPSTDNDKENASDNNKFNTYNDFKLNHDEIMEEEFEEDEIMSHENTDS